MKKLRWQWGIGKRVFASIDLTWWALAIDLDLVCLRETFGKADYFELSFNFLCFYIEFRI